MVFVIDCSKPADDTNMDFSTLEKFLQEQIKVGAKPELLVTPFPLCERDKGKITVIVITAPNLSKWYITIFILRNFQVSDQIYLRKYNLRDWLCVIALNNDKDRFLPVPRNKCLAFFLCLLKRIGRICLRSCRRKKHFP